MQLSKSLRITPPDRSARQEPAPSGIAGPPFGESGVSSVRTISPLASAAAALEMSRAR
jgi:hypothetical protein